MRVEPIELNWGEAIYGGDFKQPAANVRKRQRAEWRFCQSGVWLGPRLTRLTRLLDTTPIAFCSKNGGTAFEFRL
jgi:hypothetical protein